MAENLKGSEIIKLAGEIKEKIANGDTIYNFTIGDFDPNIFPIPSAYQDAIINAYKAGETNYPAANGIAELRKVLAQFIAEEQGLNYSAEEFLVAGGARPLIYAAYQAVVDRGEKVLFPVPSWNNNHYTHLAHGQQIFLQTTPENNFMPTANEIKPYLSEIGLLALCSPLNPTGTVFTAEDLKPICEAIVEENKRRGDQKPVYLLYDQIYWQITHGSTKHVDPVSLCPEIKPYTIYIDGLSKSLAATGVRVGWAFGPKKLINAMKSILGHIGAWAPKAEQVASAKYLAQKEEVNVFLNAFKQEINNRLKGFYEGMQDLKEAGYPVDAIAPQAAIYLTIKFDLVGKSFNGEKLNDMKDVTSFLLNEVGLAIVPFYAFGAPDTSPWFRLSVGTSTMDDIDACFKKLNRVLAELS
ncbi:aminotransferase class I/II-fold pyridoxal phosphate-dependent enzyme [Luteibaculum oceani]|uniref:Aminotransferase class I/II-fold pyridoxal phosphate-dependent enzyme n=2 Tax=Luteibaculum oceani TaxID=1294296 RepID=A0A5C6VKZ0_9FLAO|nr:aminotransferase class I/II-fold pyridoxal phosphate-dependent enzyme [Luteibaculum oceani]